MGNSSISKWTRSRSHKSWRSWPGSLVSAAVAPKQQFCNHILLSWTLPIPGKRGREEEGGGELTSQASGTFGADIQLTRMWSQLTFMIPGLFIYRSFTSPVKDLNIQSKDYVPIFGLDVRIYGSKRRNSNNFGDKSQTIPPVTPQFVLDETLLPASGQYQNVSNTFSSILQEQSPRFNRVNHYVFIRVCHETNNSFCLLGRSC